MIVSYGVILNLDISYVGKGGKVCIVHDSKVSTLLYCLICFVVHATLSSSFSFSLVPLSVLSLLSFPLLTIDSTDLMPLTDRRLQGIVGFCWSLLSR